MSSDLDESHDDKSGGDKQKESKGGAQKLLSEGLLVHKDMTLKKPCPTWRNSILKMISSITDVDGMQ